MRLAQNLGKDVDSNISMEETTTVHMPTRKQHSRWDNDSSVDS